MKPESIEPRFVDTIEGELQAGILYISEKYSVAICLCVCGCGVRTVLPFKTIPHKDPYWQYIRKGDEVTFEPSIYNKQSCPNKAHWYFRKNRIDWC